MQTSTTRGRIASVTMAAATVIAALAGCAAPSDSAAQYKQDATWLCRPGSPVTNHCTTPDLNTTTVIDATGNRRVVEHRPLDQSRPTAAFDCFYLYPTVSIGPDGTDKAMATDAKDEIFVTRAQFARFSSTCNTYAPLYRQATIAGFITPGALDAAYVDVKAAFDHYLATFNQGRPFLLIGHSQGAMHLAKLMKERFDNNAAMREKLVGAFLIGGDVTVPAGKTAGGTFTNIHLCRSTTDVGCVVAFRSSAAAEQTNPTPPTGIGNACVNPAALAGGEAVVDAKLPTFLDEAPDFLAAQIPAMPAEYADVATGWIELPGALRAKCVMDGNNGRLRISDGTAAGDDRDPSSLLVDAALGLHVVETNYLLGDLLTLATSLARAKGVA